MSVGRNIQGMWVNVETASQTFIIHRSDRKKEMTGKTEGMRLKEKELGAECSVHSLRVFVVTSIPLLLPLLLLPLLLQRLRPPLLLRPLLSMA